MQRSHQEYELSDDRARIDVDRVHSWLVKSYWSPGISRDVVARAFDGSSLVVGAYCNGQQVAVLRVISDKATFAWIADVWVDEGHRGRGIGTAMVQFALDHREHQGLRRWCLATKDAHGVYAKVGFVPLPYPERWMAKLAPKWPVQSEQ